MTGTAQREEHDSIHHRNYYNSTSFYSSNWNYSRQERLMSEFQVVVVVELGKIGKHL